MDAASAMLSPSSDDRFWSRLRDRVDAILEHRRLAAPSSSLPWGGGSERGKRLRDDSLLLIRGLDSVATSLSHLSDTLTAAQKGVGALAANPPAREEAKDEEGEPVTKRRCTLGGVAPEASCVAALAVCAERAEEPKPREVALAGSPSLKTAKNLAVSMAGKAATLARELKSIKSELNFTQERCLLLEEENQRLRQGHENRLPLEEDDLLRLQLEALLEEKSRLAYENANLMRENQSLLQLVEYHQLTSQELSESYEQVVQGMCLDFSSSRTETVEKEFIGVSSNGENGAHDVAATPTRLSESPMPSV